MARRGEIAPVTSLDDLEAAVRAWQDPTADTPIYHILSMESADSIVDVDDVAFWWEAGLRVVGPAHFGHNTYIHGTFTEGGLKPPAKPLYAAMREAGMILDITHMADQAVWESFDLWDGPIMASHCVSRSVVPGQRHLSDVMIRELTRRGGIIGLVFCQNFIDPDIAWTDDLWNERRPARFGMEGLVPHIERIAELAGGSLDNVAIGTDIDGGPAAELTPTDVDTIADLQGFPAVLEEAGISAQDIDGILSENALRFFRAAGPRNPRVFAPTGPPAGDSRRCCRRVVEISPASAARSKALVRSCAARVTETAATRRSASVPPGLRPG